MEGNKRRGKGGNGHAVQAGYRPESLCHGRLLEIERETEERLHRRKERKKKKKPGGRNGKGD